MDRLARTLVVLGLLGGTAAAFAITESRKLELAPITRTKVTKVFSPVCGCETRRAEIGFTLRKRFRLRLVIVRDEQVVRTLIRERRAGRGRHLFTWNGRDDRGRVVREGAYRARVTIDGRRIVLPNEISVDVTPPRVTLVGVRPRVTRAGTRIRVRYRVSEPARATLDVNGVRRVQGRFKRLEDELRWFGIVEGRPVPPGRYRLSVGARDPAGNLSRSRPSALVEIQP